MLQHRSFNFPSWLDFKNIYSTYSFENFTALLQLWFPPNSDDHDFQNFEYAIPEDDSTQVSSILPDKTLIRRFSKKLLYIFLCNMSPPPQLWLHPTPGVMIFITLYHTFWENSHIHCTFHLFLLIIFWLLKMYFIFLCKMLTASLPLIVGPSYMIFTTLNLQYLSHFQLSWPNGCWENSFLNISKLFFNNSL